MGKLQKSPLSNCLNCGNELRITDKYCSVCGQRTQGTKIPLKDFVQEFFQDYFTVDSKFFKSILLLIVRPGVLTKRFNDGKRKSFIAPLRMYLFTSFVYFFLLSLSFRGNSDFINVDSDVSDMKTEKIALLDSLLALEEDTVNLGQYKERFAEAEEEEDQFISLSDGEDDFMGIEEGINKANENPELLIQAGFKVASIALFFLVPIFALVLWMFHYKRSAYYAPNLVHAMHLHTFAFALFSIWLGISSLFGDGALIAIPIILGVYTIWSIKVVYSQKLIPAIFKTLIIGLIYFFLLLLALIPTLFASLMTV